MAGEGREMRLAEIGLAACSISSAIQTGSDLKRDNPRRMFINLSVLIGIRICLNYHIITSILYHCNQTCSKY